MGRETQRTVLSPLLPKTLVSQIPGLFRNLPAASGQVSVSLIPEIIPDMTEFFLLTQSTDKAAQLINSNLPSKSQFTSSAFTGQTIHPSALLVPFCMCLFLAPCVHPKCPGLHSLLSAASSSIKGTPGLYHAPQRRLSSSSLTSQPTESFLAIHLAPAEINPETKVFSSVTQHCKTEITTASYFLPVIDIHQPLNLR